ncbi:MAG: hypothetical protein U0V73_12710 [Acidimicrobiia bacterium]
MFEFTDFDDDDDAEPEPPNAHLRARRLKFVFSRMLLEVLEGQRVDSRVRARLAANCTGGADFATAMADALAAGINEALSYRSMLCDLYVAVAEHRRQPRTDEEREELREAVEDHLWENRWLTGPDLCRLFPELELSYEDIRRWEFRPDEESDDGELRSALQPEADVIPALAKRFVDSFRDLAWFSGNDPEDLEYNDYRCPVGDWTVAEGHFDGEVFWFGYGDPEVSGAMRPAHRVGDDRTRWQLLRELSLAEDGTAELCPDVAAELGELEQRFGADQPGSGS